MQRKVTRLREASASRCHALKQEELRDTKGTILCSDLVKLGGRWTSVSMTMRFRWRHCRAMRGRRLCRQIRRRRSQLVGGCVLQGPSQRIGSAHAPSHAGLLEPRGTSTVLKDPGVRDRSTWSVMP